jgi:hypothetical protein
MSRSDSVKRERADADLRLADATRRLREAQSKYDADSALLAEEANQALAAARIAWALAASSEEQRLLAAKALQGHFLADWACGHVGAGEQERRELRRAAILAASRSELNEALLRIIREFLENHEVFAPRHVVDAALADAGRAADKAIADGRVDILALLEAIGRDDRLKLAAPMGDA